MKQFIRTDDQSLVDVSFMNVGNMESVLNICTDNDLSVTDSQQMEVNVSDQVDNKKVVEVLNKNENLPATGLTDELPEGVGYWRIGLDFQTS